MKKKALAILLSLLMLTSVTLPGTWAMDETEIDEAEPEEVIVLSDTSEEDPTQVTTNTEEIPAQPSDDEGGDEGNNTTESGDNEDEANKPSEDTPNVTLGEENEKAENTSHEILPECTCPSEYVCVLPYDHEATCPLSTGNMQYLTNEQIWALWQSLTEEQQDYLRAIPYSPITEEQWAYIDEQIGTEDDNKIITVEGTLDNACTVTVTGEIPENVTVSVENADIDVADFGIESEESIISAFDLKLLEDGAEWQPSNGVVTVTLDAASLGMADGDEYVIYHQHNGEVTVSETYVVADGLLTFETNGFSIYVVIGTGSAGQNYVNHKIVMTVGDTLDVKSSTQSSGYNSYKYAWSIESGDTGSFTLSNTSIQTAKITANSEGTIVLECVITKNTGNKPGQSSGSSTTEEIEVVALNSVGSAVDDDIVFAKINKNYVDENDTEYNNTYGPYVMKIHFEDTEGNLLTYNGGTTVGNDYYVKDSVAAIDFSTFAATAPEGYTYDGAFFYWDDHDAYNGAKAYVTSVERDNNAVVSMGSHLWFSGTLYNADGTVDTQNGRWEYQASGVLHVVYAKKDEAHAVTFLDHCGEYILNSYALKYSDANKGVKFSTSRVGDIDGFATTIGTHHSSDHDGYTFVGKWNVTGGGDGINGEYTTEILKNVIATWDIKSDITITAVCTEPKVEIEYVAKEGGSVDPQSESLEKYTGVAQGSTATANSGYKFVGWYSDVECNDLVSSDEKYVPTKPDDAWIDGTTYYAKFEQDVTSLTITKSLSNVTNVDEGESFVFTIEGDGVNMQIVIPGTGSVTINGLKVGSEYIVTEDTDWSWRYTAEGGKVRTITLRATANDNKVTFTNTRDNTKWIDGNAYVENYWTGSTITKNPTFPLQTANKKED